MIKNIKYKIIVTLIILLYIIVMYVTSTPCIILSLTGVECPGCGMTRAVAAAVKLDFKEAFEHHLMFWSTPLLYICFLLDGRLFKSRTMNVIFYLLILTGFMVNLFF